MPSDTLLRSTSVVVYDGFEETKGGKENVVQIEPKRANNDGKASPLKTYHDEPTQEVYMPSEQGSKLMTSSASNANQRQSLMSVASSLLFGSADDP